MNDLINIQKYLIKTSFVVFMYKFVIIDLICNFINKQTFDMKPNYKSKTFGAVLDS